MDGRETFERLPDPIQEFLWRCNRPHGLQRRPSRPRRLPESRLALFRRDVGGPRHVAPPRPRRRVRRRPVRPISRSTSSNLFGQ
jgi:hypothetical protein